MDAEKIREIIKENERRKQKLFPYYNPITGEGSPIKRIKLQIDDKSFIYFPEYAIEQEFYLKEIILHGSLKNMCDNMRAKNDSIEFSDALMALTEIRIKHDFEFWASTCVIIWDKINKNEVNFVLRPSQRKLLRELEDMRQKGLPIRIVLLKARQWGGSTLVQMYMAWIQLYLKRNWHSVIVAHIKEAARNIRGMYSRMADKHPKMIQDIKLKPYENSQSTKIIENRGNILSIGSSETPDAQRSFDIMMAHLSEVAFFKSTEKRSGDDLVQSIRASIPKEPYTLTVLESTAKGVGNFFHNEWISAVNKESGYRPVFVAWWEIEIYVSPIDDYEAFIPTMNDTDKYHWELGATLEGIKWYRDFKKSERYSDWRMNSEFPPTAESAFQSTGRRAFRHTDVLRARRNCIPPIFIGDVTGKSMKGKKALEEIEFIEQPDGNLQIWEHPEEKITITERYVGFVDIGGRTSTADYSTIKIFDRIDMIHGGLPKVVAVWRGHLDQDLLAWKAAQLGTKYQNMLLAVEVNSLRTETKDSEGEHYLTVLDEISEHYDNLFTRTSPEKIKQGAPTVYGFHTNRATKPMIIDELNACLRDDLYVERHNISCDEFDSYEIKDNGTYGAVDGAKDDCVVVTAGGLWIVYKYLDWPREIKEITQKKKNNIVNEASF